MNLSQYRANPIICILRENNLSLWNTREEINRVWNVPPEGYPMKKIQSVSDAYLSYLVRYIRYKTKARVLSGVPVTLTYLAEAYDITKEEYAILKPRLGLKTMR